MNVKGDGQESSQVGADVTEKRIMRHEADTVSIMAKLKPLLVQNLGLSEGMADGGDVVLLGENSGIDSVGVLRLVMAVEKEFDIVIDDTDINPENLQTLKGLVSLIQQKLGSA